LFLQVASAHPLETFCKGLGFREVQFGNYCSNGLDGICVEGYCIRTVVYSAKL